MPTQRAYRQESTDDWKPLTKVALEAAAQRYGVTTSPSMSVRALAEAIAGKLQPGVYVFTGPNRDTDTYAMRACELALAAAAKAEAEADAAKAPPAAATQSAPLMGGGSSTVHAPRADAATPGRGMADAWRDRAMAVAAGLPVGRQDAAPQLVSAEGSRRVAWLRHMRVAG